MPDPNLEIRGNPVIQTLRRRGGQPPKHFFVFGLKIKGGSPAPLNTNIEEEEGQQSASISAIIMTGVEDFSFQIIFFNNYACEMIRDNLT